MRLSKQYSFLFSNSPPCPPRPLPFPNSKIFPFPQLNIQFHLPKTLPFPSFQTPIPSKIQNLKAAKRNVYLPSPSFSSRKHAKATESQSGMELEKWQWSLEEKQVIHEKYRENTEIGQAQKVYGETK